MQRGYGCASRSAEDVKVIRGPFVHNPQRLFVGVA
jgi:hypothetical protein